MIFGTFDPKIDDFGPKIDHFWVIFEVPGGPGRSPRPAKKGGLNWPSFCTKYTNPQAERKRDVQKIAPQNHQKWPIRQKLQSDRHRVTLRHKNYLLRIWIPWFLKRTKVLERKSSCLIFVCLGSLGLNRTELVIARANVSRCLDTFCTK